MSHGFRRDLERARAHGGDAMARNLGVTECLREVGGPYFKDLDRWIFRSASGGRWPPLRLRSLATRRR